jgi:hypothetical protein
VSTFDDTRDFWVEHPDETEYEQELTYTAREVARVRAESPLFRTDAELAATSEEWMT